MTRAKEVVVFLSEQTEPVSAKVIASHLGVSVRQVYRYTSQPWLAKRIVAMRAGYLLLTNLTGATRRGTMPPSSVV